MKLLNLILLLLILSCSSGNSTLAGGSSSETTSGITVISSAGKIHGTAVGVRSFKIYYEHYQPVKGMGYWDVVEVDSAGNFYHDSLISGVYNIIAKQENSELMTSLTSIEVSSDSEKNTYPGSVERAGACKVTSSLKGTDRGPIIL